LNQSYPAQIKEWNLMRSMEHLPQQIQVATEAVINSIFYKLKRLFSHTTGVCFDWKQTPVCFIKYSVQTNIDFVDQIM